MIAERSEGNAFYAEELLAATERSGGPLPSTLRDILASRLAPLPETAKAVLRIAAEAARSVDHRLLDEVAVLPAEDLQDGLREAVAHQALVMTEDGRSYRFRHALLQEAVHEELLPGERSKLHAAFAQALTRDPDLAAGGAEGVHAELAHHWFRLAGASDPEAWRRAVAWLDQYGRADAAVYAMWRLAKALLEGDERLAAAEVLEAAHRRATELGAEPLRSELEALARRGRVDLPGIDTAGDDDLGLTPPGARGPRARRRRPDQPRDRRTAVHRREDRERARVEHPHQARGVEPGEAAAVAHRLGLVTAT